MQFEIEFKRWTAYWLRQSASERPAQIVEAFAAAKKLGTYPIIQTLLHIFATIPVTTVTGERSFSALKYLKNYLRSTMTEKRLNGLAQMYINRDIQFNYERVVDIFSEKNRRVLL